MATKSENDPGAAFREIVTQWERNFDKLANEMMGTESYTQAMNQFQKTQLAAQKALTEFMTQQLTALNMPTRDDVVRIGTAVRGLDQRMERIERLLEQGSSPAAGTKRKGPPRTKKPPSAAAGE